MKVVIAIDEKACVDTVADFIKQHKWAPGTQVLLLHVISPVMFDYPGASYPMFSETVWSEVEKGAREFVAGAKALLQIPELEIETDVRIGLPVQVVTDAAKEMPADLIVVGCHGRQGVGRFFLGSVSQEIVSHAPCSTVVLHFGKSKCAKESEGKINRSADAGVATKS